MTLRSLALLTTAATLAAPLAATAPAAAQAQDFVSQANALYASIPQSQRSDLVILPAVANIADPPAQVAAAGDALLYPAGGPSWQAIADWATAQPQADALKALEQATRDEGMTTHMVFAQPYGVEGASPAMVGADLYTELGDPPTLAAADFRYLKGLEKLQSLAHVEANRLRADGKGEDALELMLDWLLFSRQIADREMAPEKVWGMRASVLALEHLRDLAYQDFQSESRSITPEKITEIIRRFDEKRSPMSLSRLLLPRADRIAVDQLLYRVYDQSTRRTNDQYGSTMARVTSRERPLRLFSEAAKWDAVRGQAAGWYEIQDALRNVANDFQKRWGLPPRDPVLAMQTDYERSIKGKPGMAAIEMRYSSYPEIFRLRDRLRAEAAGTRMSLAMYGFFRQYNQYPRDLSAVRPAFVQAVEKDPYSPGADILFFVPIRDQPKGPRGETHPHEIRVFPIGRYPNFSVNLRDDQFVIYSVGPDESKDWARNVTQAQEEYPEGDYLFWPPVSSLLRQHLMQINHFN